MVAVLIGGIEALGLIGGGLDGAFWDAIAWLNGNANSLGFAIVGVFLAAWALSHLIYRVKKFDELEPQLTSR